MKRLGACVVLLLLSVPAQAQTPEDRERVINRWLTAHSLFSAGAAAATMYGTGQGVAVEANPMTHWAQDQPVTFGVATAASVIATHWAIRQLAKKKPRAALVLAISLTGVSVWDCWRDGRVVGARHE